MSKHREQIKQIHDNTDFKVEFAGTTELGEFIYDHGGGVRPGLDYHIHYTNDKEEVYMTGGTHIKSSKIIRRIKYGQKTLFKAYTDLKSSRKLDYPQMILPVPSEDDYSVGSFNRYFTRKENDVDALVFEISKNDFENKNSLFKYITVRWRISGTKEEVSRYNFSKMNIADRDLPKVSINLFPLQYWRPSKDSPNVLQKKLLLLRNT
mgnify:CR=1 FL=1|tara:strand:- start:888 stop:1508 length:621 start_codon:yes stop_codon:yes gene_type:complete